MEHRTRLECGDCGLIYQVAMLNLVDDRGDRDAPLRNCCPNCGGGDITDWVPGAVSA